MAVLPGIAISHRWSGQVIETPDGLPYIGKMADHQYAATGFGGNGMTFGTLAGIMIADAIQGRQNRGPNCSILVERRFGAALGLHQRERGLPVLQRGAHWCEPIAPLNQARQGAVVDHNN